MFKNKSIDIMLPEIHSGASYTDSRGTLYFNNDLDTATIKRVYVMQNENTNTIRAWRGHQIEQRWFSAVQGSFKIQLIAIDNWISPSKKLERHNFTLHSDKLDMLHIPGGYVSSIQSLEEGSKLLVMADYLLNELKDDYRYESDYFE